MEKYVNEETVVKNELYESLKDNIICQICQCLMIEPIICLNCQNYFCKNCVESWKAKSNLCPLNCENPIYKNVIGKNNLISKLKFKCIKGCGEEILYDNIKEHYNSNCVKKESQEKIKFLTAGEAEKLTKEGKQIEYMSSKYIN
jgi:hypothetical protein